MHQLVLWSQEYIGGKSARVMVCSTWSVVRGSNTRCSVVPCREARLEEDSLLVGDVASWHADSGEDKTPLWSWDRNTENVEVRP